MDRFQLMLLKPSFVP